MKKVKFIVNTHTFCFNGNFRLHKHLNIYITVLTYPYTADQKSLSTRNFKFKKTQTHTDRKEAYGTHVK